MTIEHLGGRTTAGVVRIGETVRRPIGHDPTFSHAVLRHLERSGFELAPRCLGMDGGCEVLSYLPGDVPDDLEAHPDNVLVDAARLLRRFHDATADMPEVRDRGFDVACHNDWAPTNAVFRDGRPVGLIDFDTAAPGLRLWDLGYSAFTWLCLGDEDFTGPDQIRRLRAFADAYGRPDCTAAQIAVFAVARQTALHVSAHARGLNAIANWAADAAAWTAPNVLEPLLSTGYPRP